jgi:hypothetical protein
MCVCVCVCIYPTFLIPHSDFYYDLKFLSFVDKQKVNHSKPNIIALDKCHIIDDRHIVATTLLPRRDISCSTCGPSGLMKW